MSMGNMAQIHRITDMAWQMNEFDGVHRAYIYLYIYTYIHIRMEGSAVKRYTGIHCAGSWISRFEILLTTLFNYTKTADVFYLNKLNLFLLHCHGIYFSVFFSFLFFFYVLLLYIITEMRDGFTLLLGWMFDASCACEI